MSLITSIPEFKKYIIIDDNTQLATLQPFIDEAEKMYLKGLLGKTFYDEFTELYGDSITESPTPLSEDNEELLTYIQRALAYYTQFRAIPQMSVMFGELGVRVDRADGNDAAPRWQIEKLQLNAIKSGDLHADYLLSFLEENATVSNDFQTWFADSVANTKMSGRIVYSTAIASKHIDIGDSRRVFLQLRPTIDMLEKRLVPKLIGVEQYDELVTQIKTGTTIPAENLILIEKLEAIISKRALAMRVPFLKISVGGDGIWLYSDVSELRAKDFLATKEDLKELVCQLSEGLNGYEADERDLQQYILDNIDLYPMIKTTSIYTVQPKPGPTFTPTNSPLNKYFTT